MGKVRTRREKFHAAAVKVKEGEKKNVTASAPNPALSHTHTQPQSQTSSTLSVCPAVGHHDNPFSGLQIDFGSLNKNLHDLDARSTVTSKSLKGSTISKKEKRKLKHDFFIQKIDAIQSAKKEAKNKRKRKKLPVVGDMQVLADTLPTLELLLKDCAKRKEEREKNKNRVSKKSLPKMKTRQKRMMDDISVFKQVLAHPAYKSDAKATMKEHLQNWMKKREHEDDPK